MSRRKRLPDDVRKFCIALVQGYERRKKEYNLLRADLINTTPCNIVKIPESGKKANADQCPDERKWEGAWIPGSHYASRTTEDITDRVMELEKLPETQYMRAVEYAIGNVGRDLSEDGRDRLVAAIFKSCVQGRKYPFERLGIEGMERSCFYDRRMKFLIDVAKFLQIV